MFTCKVCGTQYVYEDLAKECEDRKLADPLAANVGEDIIITSYVGDDYAQPPKKAGIIRLYEWSKVIEKRIIPTNNVIGAPVHLGQYKFQHSPEMEQLYKKYPELRRWHDNRNDGFGTILGPCHYWSKSLANKEQLAQGEWPNNVIGICKGTRNKETLAKLEAEGYDI